MGREALLAVLVSLTMSGAVAVNSFIFKDQEGSPSGARLYRHASGAVYASAAPYGAYSFHIPTISAQQPSASKNVPVKESYQNANRYLQDSYGNRFVEALQSMKTLPLKPFPQQYVQLQELPAHFAQPLAAAPAHYHAQHKHTPQGFAAAHYRLPVQTPAAPAPTPLNQQLSFAHPGVYADSFRNLAPAASFFGPHFGSVIHVPVRSLDSAQNSHGDKPSYGIETPKQDFPQSVSETQKYPSAQQQPTSQKDVYADVQPQQERYHDHHLKGEHKFQRLQEAPEETYSEEEPTAPPRQVPQRLTTKQIVSAIKETPIPTVVNGKKTTVNVKTKPPLPLLDINLLEPLTFANPLVPQVQHFLPRISEATYHKLPELENHEDKKYQKEFVVQKTKSYDTGIIKGKPKKPRKKQKVPEVEHNYYDDYIPAATARPTVTITNADESPEITYEINSPNYKETYKEQAIKYNKETSSEPVHYTYGTKTQKEPVHYSYTHSSKEPVHIKEVRYEGKGEGPKHLIYNIKPDNNRGSEQSKIESEDSAEKTEDGPSQRPHHSEHKKHHSHRQETPTSNHQYEPEHREHDVHTEQGHHRNLHTVHKEQKQHRNPHSDGDHNVHKELEYNRNPHSDALHNVHKEHKEHRYPHSDRDHSVHKVQDYHRNPHSDAHHKVSHDEVHHKTHPDTHHNVHHSEKNYKYPPSSDAHQIHQLHSIDVIPFQYEEDISLSAPIKVDPNQHIHREQQQPRSSPAANQNTHPNHTPQHYSKTDSKPQQETPSTHVSEKTKQVYIQEETPEEDDSIGERVIHSTFGKEEDKEQDFENAYKNAAFGFPAFHKPGTDVEKDIYNPENYGIPRDHSDYNIDHSPFQQYQDKGDNYPKEMRANYQDGRDKLKEDYFLDYSVSKPESLVDRYKNKVNYYKLYKDQKPERYTFLPQDDKQQQSAKLTAIPYSYYPVQGDMKQFFAQYKAAPFMFEYDYFKGTPKPKDNSAHASRPFQRLMNTQFVEPQFQYGFEPIALPRLLDSELAAMATNTSPRSEKPGTRKKIYKENFYIKKTSMSDAGPNS